MTIAHFLNIYRAYVTPTLVILGITGNLLVIVVFIRRRLSRFNVYSIALLASNSLALFLNAFLDDFLGRGLFYATSGKFFFKLDSISTASCKMMEYLPNVMYFVGGYIMVIFSLDRFIVMTQPMRFSAVGFVNKAILACVSVLVVGHITTLPLSFSYSLHNSSEHVVISSMCCEMSKRRSFLIQWSVYYKSIAIFVVPSFVVTVLNCAIIYQVVRMHTTRKKLVVDQQMNRLEMARVVGMLAVTSYFLLFTIPLSVVMILRRKNEASFNYNDEDSNETIKMLSKLLSSLKDINYSSNFFIYYLFLPYFRYDLKKLFANFTIYTKLRSSPSTDKDDNTELKNLGVDG